MLTSLKRHGGRRAATAIQTVRVGVDRIELAAFRRIVAAGGDAFVGIVYTEAERHYCCGRVERLAARFAAKEAASKALGTGFRRIGPSDIEVVSSAGGEPHLRLHGRALDRADSIGLCSLAVSLTHTANVAEAFVVAICSDGRVDETDEEKVL